MTRALFIALLLACVCPAWVDVVAYFVHGILPGRGPGDLPDPALIVPSRPWLGVSVIGLYFALGITWASRLANAAR